MQLYGVHGLRGELWRRLHWAHDPDRSTAFHVSMGMHLLCRLVDATCMPTPCSTDGFLSLNGQICVPVVWPNHLPAVHGPCILPLVVVSSVTRKLLGFTFFCF